jgi:hypothetical protein
MLLDPVLVSAYNMDTALEKNLGKNEKNQKSKKK